MKPKSIKTNRKRKIVNYELDEQGTKRIGKLKKLELLNFIQVNADVFQQSWNFNLEEGAAWNALA